MDGDSRSKHLRWVLCGLLFLATTINYLDRSALGLVEPMLKHMLGGDRDPYRYNRDYSDIVICFIVAYGLGFLISGRLIDWLGAKRGYAFSIALWGLASLSHALMRSVGGFAAARFALGLGESGNFPAALKATADWFPAKERALATGIFNSGTSVASLVAPALIPLVAIRYGWQAAFLTTGSLSLLWLGGCFFLTTACGASSEWARIRLSPLPANSFLSLCCCANAVPGRSPSQSVLPIRCGGYTYFGFRSFSASDFGWI